MCRLEEPAPSGEVPLAIEDPITLDEVDVVEGALEEVLQEVVTEQVKQQLWECVIEALRRGVQWMVERVRAWRT